MKESFEKSPEYKIHKLSTDEWEKLRDVRLRAVQDSPQAFGDTLEKTEAQTEEVWRQWIDTARIYVVEDKDICVAAATLRKDTDGIWIVNAVWTDPAHRQQGLSKELFENILTDAKALDIKSIQLRVNPLQTAAVVLYESLGFKKVGETPNGSRMGDGNIHKQDLMEIQL